MNIPGSEDGVSEILGAILLISVVVLGLSVAGVAVLSTPPPQKTPAISADITRIGGITYIRPEGGDTLQRSETRIMVDGTNKTDSFSPWSSFAVGDTLTNNQLIRNSSIMFVYTGGSAEQGILSLSVP
ncbi:MAG: type IV pilin [Methanoregula sp.]|nr:type IV pilin [Methanoregula sp.]